MMEAKEKIVETLKKAIRSEEDGFHFYDYLVKKAVNKDAKRKLENLRDDEIRHKKTLVDIFKKYIGGEVGELPEEGISVLSKVFKQGQLEEKKTEMEYLNLAIEAELATTKYYQENRNMIDDPIFQEIFDKLADEEHHHYELLMSEKAALSGNYYWFGYDNGSPMEH